MILEPFEFPQPDGEPFVAYRPTDMRPSYVYLFYSPQVDAYKIGRTKNAATLKGRLKERVRQCGDTRVMALWRCHPKDAPMVERELLEKAKPHRTGRETFEWHSDFISFYAIFMDSAGWKAYSMDLIWVEPMAMKNFKECSTTVEEFLLLEYSSPLVESGEQCSKSRYRA